ncbi:lysine--tRNA ligase [Candidatus Woesebacteria bacterium]|nr:lysine--tRNA ligase [Candidatus Woesebacteria bacterium]QQG47881.1 MAG: lysine--tRNA ligase [Candidatus Woesebacteria bacterium]
MSTLRNLRQIRLEKLSKLKNLGINPYPSESKKEFPNSEIVNNFEKYESKNVSLTGRIMSWREHGNVIFGKLVDESGNIQIFIQKNELNLETNSKDQSIGFRDLKLLDIGDFIEVEGKVSKTTRGEISIIPLKVRLLTKSLRPLPEKWEGIKDPEIIFRKRYLDLTMNEERRKIFKRKSHFWEISREFMAKFGFLEIETPVLEHVTGGADAKPFVTYHNALDENFYLRISTELYQKRLIGGGFEKIYTLGPNFRNEGIDDEHLQEYYQLEWYWAYADYRDNMKLVHDLFLEIAQKVYGKTKFESHSHKFDLEDKWEEIDYSNIIKDKLNIDIFTSTDEEIYSVLEKHGIVIEKGAHKSRLVDNLWKIIRKDIAGPTFLVNVPKFISPLAKPKSDNELLTERFQVIIAGTELGNGYSELNDPQDQYQRFMDQQRSREQGDEEAQMMDIDYVEMLEYGMPPVSGYGQSERVFWILEGVGAREATFFPQMKKKYDLTLKEIYPDFKTSEETKKPLKKKK